MIKNILVPVDGSKQSGNSKQMAVMLAEKFDAVLTFIYIVPEGDIPEDIVKYIEDEKLDGSFGKLSTKVIGDALLKPILEEVKTMGVKKAKYNVLRGNPAQEIVKYANDHKIDMIVIGKRGRGGIRDYLMGSVSMKVSSLADCPVVVVR